MTEQPLADAEFKITTVQGTPVDSYGGRVSTGGIYRTDENGEISVDGLQPGVYTVAETRAPTGYVLESNPQTVEVHEDDAQYLVIRDTPLQTLVIQKYADGTTRPLPGVTFRLTDADGRNLGEYVTDEAGQIVVDGLEPGLVVVAREIRTVEGYHLNTTPQTIRVGVTRNTSAVEPQRGTLFAAPQSGTTLLSSNSGNALTFYDVPLATLVIHKVVEGTENEPLPGVEFHVTDGTGRAIGSTDSVYVTDERGEITIRNLEIGTTVRVRETKTLPGYVLDAVAKDIEIQSSDLHELTFKNARQGGLTVRKLNSATNEPLAGAEFRIAYADGRPVDNNNGQTSSGGVYTTDSNGEINITGITGTVVVTEERAPAGFSMDAANRSQTVVVNPAETQTVTFYNAPDQSIVLQKYVKGTTTPIQGARFLVTDGDGRTVGENGGEFTTDESGRITVSGLKPGTTITAREVEAAEGYVLDATPKSATIRSGSAQQITFYKEQCKINLNIYRNF